MQDDTGRLVGAVNVLVDVTDRRKAEEKANDAIRETMVMKDQFLGLVSHELRTPIATIVGNALLMLRRGDLLTEESKQQALEDVAGEGQKLQRIVENLLLLTRMDAGQQLETEPVRMPLLIEKTVESFRKRNPQRTVDVTWAAEIPVALGQPATVAQVVEDLLTNADKYSPLAAPIEISVCSEAGEVVVRVRDYGIGIGDDEVLEVFTPFYRSARAKMQANGIGLGLAACKRVIEAQGGRIWAEARREGGCDFTFTLKGAPESAS